MAKENNLGDLLEGIANAIQTKGGTTAPINAQNFEKAILDLPSGGGVDLTKIGYTKKVNDGYNKYYEDGLNYAKKIKDEWASYIKLLQFNSNEKLVFFPQVPFDRFTNLDRSILDNYNLEVFPDLPNDGIVRKSSDFLGRNAKLRVVGNLYKLANLKFCYNCPNLQTIGIVDLNDITEGGRVFIQAYGLKDVKFINYKKFDIAFSYLKSISIFTINYMIEHALGAAEGATQRTLTFDATAKARWQDPNQNPQYEYYAAMAAEKLITIA